MPLGEIAITRTPVYFEDGLPFRTAEHVALVQAAGVKLEYNNANIADEHLCRFKLSNNHFVFSSKLC